MINCAEEVWKHNSEEIAHCLNLIGIKVIDHYLVGSAAKARHLAPAQFSDIDTIYFVDEENIERLHNARDTIEAFLSTQNTEKFFHYKLISPKALANLSLMDGIRLQSWQNNYYCEGDGLIIRQYTPILDQYAYISSFIIQATYSFFEKKAKGSIFYILRIPKVRVRLKMLIENLCPNSLAAQNSREQEILRCLEHFLYLCCGNLSTREYLEHYFSIYTHESINKLNIYLQ